MHLNPATEEPEQATPIATRGAGDKRRASNLAPVSNTGDDAMTLLRSQSTSGDTNKTYDIEQMTLNTVNYVVDPENLGDWPQFIDCPHCRSRHKTRVISSSGRTLYVINTVSYL